MSEPNQVSNLLADGDAELTITQDGARTVTIVIKCASDYDAILVVDRIRADLRQRGRTDLSIHSFVPKAG